MALMAAGCAALIATGFADEKRDGVLIVTLDDFPESEWTLQDISGFAAAVRVTDSVVILEGLPYPEAEKEWYDHESKRKDLVWIRDYPFYPRPLKVSDEELHQLKGILSDPKAHLEFPKLMPSLLTEDFHPNYAVVWSKDGQRVGSLIDLGSRHEWKNFTPSQVLYGRIASEPYKKLSKILGKYQQERPEMMSYFIAEAPPSDQMRALVRAISEHGVLSMLAQQVRVPVRELESPGQVERAAVSPSGVILRDTVSLEELRSTQPGASKPIPDDELMVVRKLDGSRYWIVRKTDYGAAEAFLGPDLHAAIAVPSITAADIPASILGRTVTESDWRSLYDHLCSEMAKWHTPTHEPELVETFWDPIFYLKPRYYFIDGQNLGEIEICEGTWFAAYRGMRVSELVAIGRANREEYRKNPLGIADAVRLCLAANWSNGCHAYLAINQGMDSVSFPGLNQSQVDSLAAANYRVILDNHMSFVVNDDRHTEAKRRSNVVKFMELYNAALFEQAANRTPPPETPVGLPAGEAEARPR
jgi:hypothetical protein